MRRRIPRWVWWALAVIVVAGAPVAWYLGSPLFINRVVDEPFPTAAGPETFPMSKDATVPEGMTRQQVEDQMMEASKIETTMSDAMPAAQSTLIARGTFTGADAFHKGEGTAAVHRVGQELILRLEAFKVTNGPDLYVILTKRASPKTSADVGAGYVEIAKLKGNIGAQNYTLPAGVDLSEYAAVVIYCKPFHVVFATAPLAWMQ